MVRRKKTKNSSKSRKEQITKKNIESNSEKDKESIPPLMPLKPEKKPYFPESKAAEPKKTARGSRPKDVGSYERQSSSRYRNRRTVTRSRTQRRSRSRPQPSSLRWDEGDVRSDAGRRRDSRRPSAPRSRSRRPRTYHRSLTPILRSARRSRGYTYRRRRSRSRSRHRENPFVSDQAQRRERAEARERDSGTTIFNEQAYTLP